MTTRKVRLGVKTFLSFLTFVVCMCICSVPASATLIMVDATAISVNISEVVVITITSDDDVDTTEWGVYLQSNPANADLQNAAVIPTTGTGAGQGAGNNASLTLTDPSGYDGDDYQAAESGGGPTVRIYTGVNWSTVEFVASAVGTYYVDLYDYTAYGGSYSSPPGTITTKTITVTPEPAMIGLLGLGGMFLLGRRRRT